MADETETTAESSTRASATETRAERPRRKPAAASSTKSSASQTKTAKAAASKTKKKKTATTKKSTTKAATTKKSSASSPKKTTTGKTDAAPGAKTTAKKPTTAKTAAKTTSAKKSTAKSAAKTTSKKSAAKRPRKKPTSSLTETAIKEFTDGSFDMEDVQAGLSLLLEKAGSLLGAKGLFDLAGQLLMPTRSTGIELFPQDAPKPPSPEALDEIAANLPADLTPEEMQRMEAALEWMRAGAPSTPERGAE